MCSSSRTPVFPAVFVAVVFAAVTAVSVPAGSPTSSRTLSHAQGNGAEYFYSLDPARGVYRFGYDTGTLQHQSFREETRTEDGGVRGSYGYVDAGVLRITEYIADQSGYRCQQTIRYLVEPEKGVFVKTGNTHQLPVSEFEKKSPYSSKVVSNERDMIIRHRSIKDGHDSWKSKSIGQMNVPIPGTHGWGTLRQKPAQPARVLGKKVAGHYTDFTSEPAVGGTGLVKPWDSAHKSELHDEEIAGVGQQRQQMYQPNNRRQTVGGTLVWPVTEDGTRVVWQPF